MGNRAQQKTAISSQARSSKTRLRQQSGSKPYDRIGPNAYDGKSARRKIHAPIVSARTGVNASRSAPSQMRSQRGNLGTKDHASPARPRKSLRRQFGKFYDQRKIGNKYTLDTDPPKLNSQPAPPERLELGFSTADVIVRGARLAPLVELLAAHKLAALEALASDVGARYANLQPSEPWVAVITIARLDRPGSAAG